jgi:hypothetical protein
MTIGPILGAIAILFNKIPYILGWSLVEQLTRRV